ncbi:MAG: phosphoenolpyruvate synthase [Candidatus Jacksonbacteria bacterium RIFOXYC2_FULL_44_29]|nr:MAG: phosphoenolpyruvate synthase [Candidatus Jacksonbacteria bacterium RIFOXYA2_FULL_43_12]OGY78307.1 MAG: phosphoenolpyruvate synthase [Candidatus Jacksonbacteria bacterium RIFOXYC2_FULL_44_29]HBH46256.1 phosphoenolpyruvate synthase [Candidatus Jacksonbacteria bacterium]HCE49384.1 phosphoenolpyruvate synthase [Candidatus Jacksonbacteria bacterium]
MSYIKFFKELGIKDVPTVGGKNASLGEMYRHLTTKGVKIPNGFAITAQGYQYFLKKNNLNEEMAKILEGLDTKDIENLRERGAKLRELILTASFPEDLQTEIISAYQKLGANDVAVRSSATAEDLPDASFAGQQETYLNIRGNYHLLESVKKCFASLFTDRAISYRIDKGFDNLSVYLSVGVQEMIRSDKASSGVMFTIDTESGHPDMIVINAVWGLGEYIVQGTVNPDEYYVHKPTLKLGYRSIVAKTLGSKSRKLVYSAGGANVSTKDMKVPKEEQRKYALTDDEVLELARWGLIIEEHYSAKRGHHQPMDIEWAKDGRTGELFIVQARPETVHSTKAKNIIEEYILEGKGKVLVAGASVGSKIAAGTARVIIDVGDIDQFQAGEVLVTEMTDPDWEPIMKKAAAIVTNSGGRTSHAAIVSRELGLPCVVGTGTATKAIKSGEKVTVCCAEGESGKVYQGVLKFTIRTIKLDDVAKTKTKILMNIGDPDVAFGYSQIPNDGVGLARLEFIIANAVKVHPLALLDFKNECKVAFPSGAKRRSQDLNSSVCRTIAELTYGYKVKSDFFVDKLALGVGRIAAAFYPREVILRFSDFKSNEYANLLGGEAYEPKEENPMIGWRGASRYYTPAFRPAFDLECLAIRRVREEMGLYNLAVMIPFCRTIEEGQKVIDILKENKVLPAKSDGNKNRLKIYVMCEIPSNVILAEDFADLFDGFSIGSNDLTQLTLGVDRDSDLVAHVYDERNPAVKKLVAEVIKKARSKGKKVGICGQAPSDFPDFAEFLVEEGIDSISLNPDTVVSTRLLIAKVEERLKKKKK